MIISASRRTDIPAFYSKWFMNRLEKGFVYVRNPMNHMRISRVLLNPEVVDCIVFWTKNAGPMLDDLDKIGAWGYSYYFQFTLNPYDGGIERNLPGKLDLIKTFKKLSDKIGKSRIIWRYDPVIINKNFSLSFHLESFDKLCACLADFTDKCIFSFVDCYTKTRRRIHAIPINELDLESIDSIARGFSQIAKTSRIILETCSEEIDLDKYGISHAACIDQELIENITGCPIKAKKDGNQRKNCRCIESIDIGAYDSCNHGCIYCYATSSKKSVDGNMAKHDINSPLLIGQPGVDHTITSKAVKSLKIGGG